MADNLTDTAENGLLDHLFGTQAFSITTPIKLALCTTATTPSDTVAGTEVTGGSYARQTITFSNAASGATSNNAIINFTGMPACTVGYIEIYDTTGTPKRLAYGALGANKTLSAGDTLQFAATAVSISLS